MNKYFPLLVAIILLNISCKQQKETVLDAKSIVDKAIVAAGGEKFEVSTISFDFRDKHYVGIRNNGMFQYERHFKDSITQIKDVLSNDGFQRFKDEVAFAVPDSMAPRYSRSVNSVHYFSVLPFGLNDAAVNKTSLNEVSIKGKAYYKIKVDFNQDGGGDDFEDIFVYWISKDDFKVNYIAYSYMDNEVDLGLRFREAYNERIINGIRFVDYNNYKPETGVKDLLGLDLLFEANKLKLLSKIENENVEVN